MTARKSAEELLGETLVSADRLSTGRVRVGQSDVDLATGEVSRAGAQLRLGPRAVRLLRLLLDARGALVANEEIHRVVWQRTVVEHNTVQAHVSALRRALGDDRNLLQTYPGRGYRIAVDQSGSATLPLSAESAGNDRRRHDFPTTAALLIGRERLMEALTPLLARHRLVTLTGAGGIGKTRLMLDAVRVVADRFPGGAFFVDLTTLRESSLVQAALITSIGAAGTFQRSLAERAQSLGTKPVLVALDNCEHLVWGVASAMDVMLAANPAIHILATSREPVRAVGEVIFQVPPLEVPPHEELSCEQMLAFSSIRLFLSRSPTLLAHVESSPEVARSVCRICRNLDGIPLAIELAAARAHSLGAETVAARLHECLDLMKGGARTAPPRHQTLRATLEWSYELLAPAQRIVFAHLAIFPGGFTIEAAHRVVSDDPSNEEDILERIADLVDKSLLSVDIGSGGTRYRFLETTRAFAFQKLSTSGQLAGLARRHTQFRLDALKDISAHGDPRTFHANVVAFKAEFENVRACLDWAYSPSGDVVLGFALASRAVPLMRDAFMMQEAVRHAARAVEMTPEALVTDKVQDLQLRSSKVASSMYITGATDEAMREWLDVLARARRLSNGGFELRAYWGLWTINFFAGRPKDALGFADEFAGLAERIGDAPCVVLGERTRGVALHYLGDQNNSRRHLERMISRYVHSAEPIIGGGLMNHATAAGATLARVLWFQGFPDRAFELAMSVVADAVAQDHPTTICFALVECAIPLCWLRGNVDAAGGFLELLFASFQRQALVVFEIVGRCYATLLNGVTEGGATVSGTLRATIDELSALRFEMYSTELRLHLARELSGAGQVQEAMLVIDQAISSCEARQEALWRPELTRMRVEYAAQFESADTNDDAEDDVRSALAEAKAQGSLMLELRVATTLARLLERRARLDDSVQVLSDVQARLTEGFDTVDAREAKELLARLGTGRASAARRRADLDVPASHLRRGDDAGDGAQDREPGRHPRGPKRSRVLD